MEILSTVLSVIFSQKCDASYMNARSTLSNGRAVKETAAELGPPYAHTHTHTHARARARAPSVRWDMAPYHRSTIMTI
jgi:hypothetical protein